MTGIGKPAPVPWMQIVALVGAVGAIGAVITAGVVSGDWSHVQPLLDFLSGSE